MKRRELLPPLAATVEVADIGLAHDGDGFRGSVFILVVSGISSLLVAGRSGGGDGQESGNDKLLNRKSMLQLRTSTIATILRRNTIVVICPLPASC